MLYGELRKRELPDCFTFLDGNKITSIEEWKLRKREIIELFRHNVFGYLPNLEPTVKGVTQKMDSNSLGGKANHSLVEIQIKTLNGYFSFPCDLIIPKNVEKPPVFLYISFSPNLVHDNLPLEEIIDSGFAVASFYYQDIVPDKDDNFMNGLGLLGERNRFDSWGKIAMWAWAASRIMDYLMTLDSIDNQRIAIMGHSRLGKTALWCGANDERFSLVVSNNSGAGGAALFRGKIGEQIKDLVKVFPYWFNGNFKTYINREDKLPLDQHFLLSMIAPRYLYVCSAKEDDWADPKSEFLSCVAASPVYKLYSLDGLVSDNSYPKINEALHIGEIGYHLRKGTHFLGRDDWKNIIEFRNKKDC